MLKSLNQNAVENFSLLYLLLESLAHAHKSAFLVHKNVWATSAIFSSTLLLGSWYRQAAAAAGYGIALSPGNCSLFSENKPTGTTERLHSWYCTKLDQSKIN